MTAAEAFASDTVQIGKKGQITIPKKIRDHDLLREDDTLIINRLPSGDLLLRKRTTETPEERILQAIHNTTGFNARKAWTEVESERARERS